MAKVKAIDIQPSATSSSRATKKPTPRFHACVANLPRA